MGRKSRKSPEFLIRNPPSAHHELPTFFLASQNIGGLPHLPRTEHPKTSVPTFLLGTMEAALDAMGMPTGSDEQLGQLNDVLSKQVEWCLNPRRCRCLFTTDRQ